MSADSDADSQEKSFEATESKIRKSRKKGDIAQSTELNVLMIYIGFLVAIVGFSDTLFKHVFIQLNMFISRPAAVGTHLLALDRPGFGDVFVNGIILYITPFFFILCLSVLASLIIQRSLVFAPDKLRPKLSRISLVSNMKQKYGRDGIVEFAKRFFKMLFIAIIACLFLFKLSFKLPGYGNIDMNSILPEMKTVTLQLVGYMIVGTGIVVLIDLPYSRFSHLQKLRMTLREVRDEQKEAEGDAQLKSERRTRAQALANSQMIRDVKTADVVIVNPTHYSVALRWDRGVNTVPACVAKGVDEMAATIRRIAKENQVPIHSNPVCARSLYATVEVGQMIQEQHYAAVAASIHFADMIKAQRKIH